MKASKSLPFENKHPAVTSIPEKAHSRRSFLALVATASMAPAARSNDAFSQESLKSAAAYSRQHDGRSILLWQNGRILLEEYNNGANAQTRVHARSIAKSLWALALLHEVEKKTFRLDTKIQEFLPEWKTHEWKKSITIQHLLGMTSGLAASGALIYGEGSTDLRKAVMKVTSEAPPGAYWNYGPSHYEVLGEMMRRMLAQTKATPESWLYSSLCQPTGMNMPAFRHDKNGVSFFSAGIELTARDLLAVGVTLLQKGKITATRRLVREETWSTATAPQRENPVYGLGFWSNRCAMNLGARECHMEDLLEIPPGKVDWNRVCFSQRAPSDMLVMLGSSGQRVYVSPSLQLVIIRQGEEKTFRDADFWKALTL